LRPGFRRFNARPAALTNRGDIMRTDYPIGRIRVGERHRKDLGDIAPLAASIAEVGLLHPIVIRPDGTLIAGERRLRAAELLGWTEIPVTIREVPDGE
jgi:ParB family chromosome partitioning protein